MNPLVNIYDMPGVISIISSAQKKIKVLTGVEVKLIAADVTGKTLNTSKEALKQLTQDYFNMSWAEITSKSRATQKVYARYFYAWVAVKVLRQPTTLTGNELGSRDHTTILNGLEVIKRHTKKNTMWAADLRTFIELYNKQNQTITDATNKA